MSKFKDILIDVEDLLVEGYTSDKIAEKLDIPLFMVHDAIVWLEWTDSELAPAFD